MARFLKESQRRKCKDRFQTGGIRPKWRFTGRGRKEVINLSSDMNKTAYEQFINTPGRIWDPDRYLNIFVAKYADGWTSTGAYTYIAVPPTVIQKGQELFRNYSNGSRKFYSSRCNGLQRCSYLVELRRDIECQFDGEK